MFSPSRFEAELSVFKNCWHSIQHDVVFSEALWLARLAKASCSILSKLSWGLIVLTVTFIIYFFASSYFRFLVAWESIYSLQVVPSSSSFLMYSFIMYSP